MRVIVTDGEVEIRYAIPTSPAGEATRFCQLRADYRAPLGQAQGVEGRRNPLREDRLILHGRPLPRRHSRLDQAMTGPICLVAVPLGDDCLGIGDPETSHFTAGILLSTTSAQIPSTVLRASHASVNCPNRAELRVGKEAAL